MKLEIVRSKTPEEQKPGADDDGDWNSQVGGSLLRGLEVLRALNEKPPISLAALHRVTGFPKPTLLRLLDTLCAAGYVRRVRDGFAPTPRLQVLSAAVDREQEVVEIATPLMNSLCQAIAWPSDLAVRDGDLMVIRASTRTTGPIHLAEPIVRSGLQIFRSELGIAYLAWSSDEERQRTLQQIARSAGIEEQTPTIERDIDKVIRETRRRGYALRTDCMEVHDLDAMAVPIFRHGAIVASISIVFHSRAVPVKFIEKNCLPKLRWTANAISSALSAPQPKNSVSSPTSKKT